MNESTPAGNKNRPNEAHAGQTDMKKLATPKEDVAPVLDLISFLVSPLVLQILGCFSKYNWNEKAAPIINVNALNIAKLR